MGKTATSESERRELLGVALIGETHAGYHVCAERDARERVRRIRELAETLVERYRDCFEDDELLAVAFRMASRRLMPHYETWHAHKTEGRR